MEFDLDIYATKLLAIAKEDLWCESDLCKKMHVSPGVFKKIKERGSMSMRSKRLLRDFVDQYEKEKLT